MIAFASLGFISTYQIASATSSASSTKVQFNNPEAISIEVVSNTGTQPNVVELNPIPGGDISTGTAAIRVTTNRKYGYTLTIQDTDQNTALVSDTSSIPTGIPKPDTSAWGYRVDETANWYPMSTMSQVLKRTATFTPEEGDLTTITFGVSINPSQPGGTYTGEVSFIATTNDLAASEPERPTLSDLTYMQDMTSTICTNSTTEETKQLIDKRDGKTYWVTKLADGNCWMTQNLALDITTAGLTSETSDLGYSNGSYPTTPKLWNSSSTYKPTATETSIPTTTDSSQTGTRSWNLGKYYELIHDGSKNCGNVSSISNCVSQGILGTSPAASDGVAGGAADHYLIGNYYQWNTATAGTGGTITSGTASDSICPRNWKLPTSNNTNNGSFAYLLTQYGLQSSVTGSTNPATGQPYNIATEPLFFVRSGYVYPNASSNPYRNAGYYGYYWSSTPSSGTDIAYALYFNTGTSMYPSDYNNRLYGFSLRCLAR